MTYEIMNSKYEKLKQEINHESSEKRSTTDKTKKRL